jgi:ATP-dependent DNA helicase RecG
MNTTIEELERWMLTPRETHRGFEAMDGKERVRACLQQCVLRWMMNQKMNNQSLRERFDLPDTKTELVSGIIADAIQQNKIKVDNHANTSRRYAKYVPYWAWLI